MRLVEKTCPNCGENLEFDENDKSCECQYCKKWFEIERNLENDDEYTLTERKADKFITIIDWILLGPAIAFLIYSIYRLITLFN